MFSMGWRGGEGVFGLHTIDVEEVLEVVSWSHRGRSCFELREGMCFVKEEETA